MYRANSSRYIFAVLVIISILIIACSRDPENNFTNNSNNEMGNAFEMKYESWDKVYPKLKTEFESSYSKSRQRRQIFEEYYDSIGPSAMLDFLEKKYTLCHSQAHDLGKVIYSRQKDINQSLIICGNRCTNACMHGVVTEAFGDKSIEEVVKFSKTFCDTDQMNKLHKKGNCMHGLGHALMIVTGNDLDKSLKACKEFPEPALGYYCATGVFMQYRDNLVDQRKRIANDEMAEHDHSNHIHDSHTARETDKSTQGHGDFSPCDIYNQYPAACYRYMFPVIRSKLNLSRLELIKKCEGLPEMESRGCFHGLGSNYIVSVSRNPSNITKLCDQGDYEDKVMCVEGVIEKLSDMNEEPALKACSYLKGDLADVCLSAARGKMYRLNKPTMYLYLPKDNN